MTLKHYNDSATRCCLPGAWEWYCTDNNARMYAEPLPETIIIIAHAAGVDPHRLWDELEADGWEAHDSGLAVEAALRVGVQP